MQATRFEIGIDGMGDVNPIKNLATEDLHHLAYAQHMALTAQTDVGKRMFELFVEQERQRIEAYLLPVSGLGQAGA